MIDGFGRRIDYLRVSVTDRCNLRCVYCLPAAYGRFAPAASILSDDELVSLLGAFARAGIRRVRLTGGEPLARPGLPALVRRIASLRGIEEVSMSTNGVLLEREARALAEAGLGRVNVSLDSLDPDRFRAITRHGEIARVLAGIDAALEAGLSPVKINCVVARGVNDGEVAAFASLADRRPLHVRFIELMPMGATGFFEPWRRVPIDEIRAAAGPLEPEGAEGRPAGHGPAAYFRRPGALGTVGFIGALSCGFCAACNRMRLTASGRLVPCLDGDEGVELGEEMRAGASPEAIVRRIHEAADAKPEAHRMVERSEGGSRFMCQVGG